MINWQLSKQGICWPVSPYRTAGSSVDPSTNNQFQMIAGLSLFFQWFVWNMLCLCHYGPTLLRFWFQTDLVRDNSASFFFFFFCNTCGEDLFLPWSRVGHALRPIFMLWLVHAENLCSILKVVYFDSWSRQTFVSTCDVFNRLFPLDVQNEIQLLSRVFCFLRFSPCLIRKRV